MKTKRKALLLTLCAVLLVAASVFGTIAYLTDTEAVTNTFEVGQVGLSMNEAKVDEMGKVIDGADRVAANKYNLLPGMTYSKDPIVHVDADSEDAWIFIAVDNNGIEVIEEKDTKAHPGYKTVSAQILENGWTWMKQDGNVHYFYQKYTKDRTDKDLKVFQQFKVADSATNTDMKDFYDSAEKISAENAAKAVIVTAYAVQAAGFDSAEEAWNANFSK